MSEPVPDDVPDLDADVDLGLALARIGKAATTPPELGFHTGEILAWDGTAQTNQVLVLGRPMNNLPILTSAGTTGLEVGALVGILRVRTQYFILGRVVTQDSGLVNPQFSIPLYAQFANNLLPGAGGGYNRVDVGDLVYWEGRARIAFPYIEVDGIWGIASGAGSATYDLSVNTVQVGSWTETGLVTARRGPFDVSQFMGLDWVIVTVGINASSGTGERAIQVLGCYFRDS